LAPISRATDEKLLFGDNKTRRINGINTNLSDNNNETAEHMINKNHRPFFEKEKTMSATNATIQTERIITKILNIPVKI
jgi:hypothetical protein